jgi:copper(I)-binding protein
MFSLLRRPKKAETAASVGQIEIQEPWTRTLPDKPQTAGAFMTVVNAGSVSDRLLGATGPEGSTCELQGIRVTGPSISMARLVDGLYLHHGAAIVFKPRGYHLILQLPAPLVVGERLPITLAFEQAGRVEVSFEVRPPGTIGEQVLHAP